MKAAVGTGFGAQLEIQDAPVPEPGPGRVRLGIETNGTLPAGAAVQS